MAGAGKGCAGMDRDQSDRLFGQLAGTAANDASALVGPDLVSGDDRHYFVAFTLGGQAIWLAPDEARWFAASLVEAADDADQKMTDEARRELYEP
jgi:hypothetical protein